jgi:GxGYxYP putative glycoside hydrolase C-terminal domain/GxGYxYP_N second domain
MLRFVVQFICVTILFSYALIPVGVSFAADASSASDARWWPIQKTPTALVRLEETDLPSPRVCYEMMAQSVAGLAAKAMNEHRGDELVWIGNGNVNYEEWLARRLKRRPTLEVRGTFGVWELIDRHAKQGIIKGYILYKSDDSKGDYNQHRTSMNCSVNVATSIAGIVNGIIVDEKLEDEAKAHGLARLIDVRDKTQAWCFENYRDQFNRYIVCTQDPRKPNVRDLAIAQKAFTVYGYEEPAPTVMEWLEPLSLILGWNGGDEFKTTDMSTRWGHIQTATDWCDNLPVLMAGMEQANQTKLKRFDPRTIDWTNRDSALSFVSTDGDNVQWLLGNYFLGAEGASYWGNPERGKIPFGWSCCFSQLAQLCPEAIDYAVGTRSPNDQFIEWGGGYYYPDRFALNRPSRWKLLAEQARRTWAIMKRNNTQIIGFNVADYDCPDARKAYEVFASQTDGLLAIFVFQYSPYEAGAGETFWIKDRNGVELPVITARYSIWEHSNNRVRSGTPAKVAREIKQTVEQTPRDKLPRYDWVITHAWSYFKRSPGTDEGSENMSQENAVGKGGVRGYSPAVWCAERLPENIRVISPEELVWRMRMNHNPSQTKTLMSQIK